ncbi:YcxB family protein [Chryseobacterium indoltheticum]
MIIFFQSGNQNYLFPKKAMAEEDYIFFKEIIKTRLSK